MSRLIGALCLIVALVGCHGKPPIAPERPKLSEADACEKYECSAKASCSDVRRGHVVTWHGEHSWEFRNECDKAVTIRVERRLFDSEGGSDQQETEDIEVQPGKTYKDTGRTKFEATYSDGTRYVNLTAWTMIWRMPGKAAVKWCQDTCRFTVR